MVVLGGALSLASPFFLPVIEETLRERALEQAREIVKITASAHGADACVMGACTLVLDYILREPYFLFDQGVKSERLSLRPMTNRLSV